MFTGQANTAPSMGSIAMMTHEVPSESRDYTVHRGYPSDPAPDLIERCRRGDIPAFEEVYRLVRAPLYSLAYRFHGNRFDAEDSLQDAFLSLFRNIGSFRGRSRFMTWMYRIVLNTCIARRRRKQANTERSDFSDEHLHPGATPAERDALLQELLTREITRLPEQQRAVFLLYAAEGFTHPEIAETLNMRVGTSKSYYHRAKETLKKRLAAQGIDRTEGMQ